MKNNLLILCISLSLFIISCESESCDLSSCKYKKGDEVKIKNKTFHDNATVLNVDCGCKYTISYYSYLGVRRHRIVEEVEIK